jgi:hypothetical protein
MKMCGRAGRPEWERREGKLRKVLVCIAAVAAMSLAGATGAFAGYGGPNQVDDTLSGGYFSGGVSGRGYVKITRVHPNPNTGCVSLRLRLLGWKMYPGQVGQPVNQVDGGHYHVYVNGKYYAFGSNAERARACGLTRGRTHSLRVVLAYNNHTELKARSQTITVTL